MKPTPTVLKIARHLLLCISRLPPDALLDLTEREIANEIGVSERSVIRAMPHLRHAIEHVGRGRWRVCHLATLETIANNSLPTPPSSSQLTPTTVHRPPPPSHTLTQHQQDALQSLPTFIESFADLATQVNILRLQVASMREELSSHIRGRSPQRPPSAPARLTLWVEAQTIPYQQIADKFGISPQLLRCFANGTRTPPRKVRELIRSRTGIGVASWNSPKNQHPRAKQLVIFGDG